MFAATASDEPHRLSLMFAAPFAAYALISAPLEMPRS